MRKLRIGGKLIKMKGIWKIYMEAYCLITWFKTIIGRDSRTLWYERKGGCAGAKGLSRKWREKDSRGRR